MADELRSDVALELARNLRTIKGFPWDGDTVTAEDLIHWCKGAIVDNQVWPAEAQARWLVNAARENWEEWKSTAALKALFRGKFEPAVKPGNAAIDFSKEPCVCGSGKQFRLCCQGKPSETVELETLRRSKRVH